MIRNRNCNAARTARALALAGLFLVSSGTGLLAKARSPDRYFNAGANRYIDDEIESAKQIVEEGLERYRNDPKLNAVKKLLDRQEQEDQKDQDQQDQDEKQDQQKQDEDQQDKNDQQDQNEKQDQQDQERGDSQENQDKQKQEQQQQPTPEEISREEAEMLLDAMEQDEKAAREKMRLMLGRPQKVEKDW